jgi:small-conductance mechanosensitive channel
MVVRKSTRVAPGLCQAHKRKRIIGLLTGWGLFLFGLVTMGYAASDVAHQGMMAGVMLVVAGIIVAVIRSRIVMPKRIDAEYARYKGCGAPFLDSLTAFGQPSTR